VSANLFLVLLAALYIADGLTTMWLLKRPDNVEANPAIRFLIERLGVSEALIVVKVGMFIAAAANVTALGRHAMLVTLAVYLVVVGHNYWLVLEQRRAA
jgi:hypothetical protein